MGLMPRISLNLNHIVLPALSCKKYTYFHLQKPSRSLLENGLGGQATYYLLSELPPKLSVLSVHVRMVIHPARRQLG